MDELQINRKNTEEKMLRRARLEKEYNMWEKRRAELRKAAMNALDPAFVKRNIDKCSNEMARISKLMNE